jgi:hypothetical protein
MQWKLFVSGKSNSGWWNSDSANKHKKTEIDNYLSEANSKILKYKGGIGIPPSPKKMERFNKFLVGLIPGLMLPVGFMWLYLNRFYPTDLSFLETIKQLYPGFILGKLLMLSIMPNLILVFVFYKSDSFNIAAGMMIGAMPYLISSFFML